MTSVYDVPADLLIAGVAKKLTGYEDISPPEWALFVKTGTHREKAPMRDDWWHLRAAAVLRKIYMKGPIGVERIAAEYGGKSEHGSAPYHTVKGSRAVAREMMKQLEKVNLVRKERGLGRSLTPSGRSLLDNMSHEILKELAVSNPELTKYL